MYVPIQSVSKTFWQTNLRGIVKKKFYLIEQIITYAIFHQPDFHDIHVTEILLKVALSTLTLPPPPTPTKTHFTNQNQFLLGWGLGLVVFCIMKLNWILHWKVVKNVTWPCCTWSYSKFHYLAFLKMPLTLSDVCQIKFWCLVFLNCKWYLCLGM